MANGSWKRIDEIVVGDEILSWTKEDGVVKDRVKDVWFAGVKPVVKVSCSGFPDIVCTADHRFWIHNAGHSGRWQEIGTIREKGVTGSRDNLAVISRTPRGCLDVLHAELYGHLVTDGASAIIEDFGVSMTWDIETEKTGCFFANGYLVHNSGKDDTFLHHTACSMFERVGNYWYMLPEYSQARKAMWDAINPKTGRRRIDDAFPSEIRETVREQEMSIKTKNGSMFQLVGADNFNSLVGSPPVGLVFSEYALSDPSSWGYLMPIIEENGGWVGFNSTPRGKNHFKGMCEFAEKEKDWFYSCVTANDTDVFSAEQLAVILRQMQATYGDEYGRSLWEQEYLCSFDAAIPGSVWGDCLTILEAGGRHADFPHTPGLPVFTGWDLGYDDDTAIWFYQVIGGNLVFIDYEDNRFKDVEFYADLLKKKERMLGYEYGRHWLPHDARPRTIAGGGKSILQQLIACDVGRCSIAPRLDLEEGIQASRATFKVSSFDKVKTAKGYEYLRGYRRKWDEEKKVFSTRPDHDFNSHAADAFRTVALTWKHSKDEVVERGLDRCLVDGNIVNIRFGEIKRQHLERMRKNRYEHS